MRIELSREVRFRNREASSIVFFAIAQVAMSAASTTGAKAAAGDAKQGYLIRKLDNPSGAFKKRSKRVWASLKGAVLEVYDEKVEERDNKATRLTEAERNE